MELFYIFPVKFYAEPAESHPGGSKPKPFDPTKTSNVPEELDSCGFRRLVEATGSTLQFHDHCYSRLHCKLDHELASPFCPLVDGPLKLQHRCPAATSYETPPREPPSTPFSLYFRHSTPFPPWILQNRVAEPCTRSRHGAETREPKQIVFPRERIYPGPLFFLASPGIIAELSSRFFW